MPADYRRPPVRLHRRQFLLGPEPFRACDDWHCREVGESTWLSHCPELRTGWASDADGLQWALLGLAVETIEEHGPPLARIAQTPSPQVPALSASWAGRWLLITDGEVHPDACGLLGSFWGLERGRTWVSSSPALLARALFDDGPPAADPRPLRFEAGICWVTPPRSRFPGMNRLLPSQVLDLAAGRPRLRTLVPDFDSPPRYEDVLDLVASSLVTTQRRVAAELGPPWLGLTAGYDSRVVLAAAYRGGVEVRPFTRIAGRVSPADRTLPPTLARECGYEHRFVLARRASSDRRALVREHSAGHVAAGDVEPLVQGSRDRLDGVSIGGHGFSVGGGFGNLRDLPAVVEDASVGARQIAELFGEPPASTATAGLREWLEWVLERPQGQLDWRDRFFIEQRMGGWLSAKEQVYDMAWLTRFPLLNAARNHALLLSLPEGRRLRSAVQVELLRRLHPALLEHPVNPSDRELGRLRSLLRRSRHPLYLARKAAKRVRA